MKQRIYNRLRALLKEGSFYPCSVNVKTGAMRVDLSRPVQPTGVVVKEITSSWNPAVRYKRDFGPSELSSWRWSARLTFAEEVACEEFEEMATDTGIAIPPSEGVSSQRRLLARLVDSDYDHPPEQSPTRGTTVTFVFEIVPELLRK